MSPDLDRLIEAVSTRYFGKYRAVVTDTADPNSSGRLKLRVPAVMGEREVWAMPCVPYAGDGVGWFALPPVGSSVWCEFEGGELNQPIWAGCFWNRGQIDAADAKDSVFFVRTPGLSLRVDHDSGEVVIESAAGPRITLSQSGVKIEGHEVELSANGATAKLSATGFDALGGALSVGP